MRAHFQGFRAHCRLWVHLSHSTDLKWLTGPDMRAHYQGFRAH